MPTSTIRLHRILRAPPEKGYRAFLNANAMCKWIPPNGYIGKIHNMDVAVGGTCNMSFTNFSTGHSQSFGGAVLFRLARIAHIANQAGRS